MYLGNPKQPQMPSTAPFVPGDVPAATCSCPVPPPQVQPGAGYPKPPIDSKLWRKLVETRKYYDKGGKGGVNQPAPMPIFESVGLKGMGFMEYLSAAASLFGQGGSGGGGGAAPAPSIFTNVSTNTNVNTQVNPQISPVFVQQDEPRDSPVTTAVAQTNPQLPGTPPPITGQIPGIDPSRPLAVPPPVNLTTPILAATALLGLALVLKNRNTGKRRR